MKKNKKPAKHTKKAAKAKAGEKARRAPRAAKAKSAVKHPAEGFTKKELAEIKTKLDEMRGSLSKNVEDKIWICWSPKSGIP